MKELKMRISFTFVDNENAKYTRRRGFRTGEENVPKSKKGGLG